jgi:hypothetical protein
MEHLIVQNMLCLVFNPTQLSSTSLGISTDPIQNANWFLNTLLPEVDPNPLTNEEGFIGFWSYNGTKCCKTTQILINLEKNVELNSKSVIPFGNVVSGKQLCYISAYN